MKTQNLNSEWSRETSRSEAFVTHSPICHYFKVNHVTTRLQTLARGLCPVKHLYFLPALTLPCIEQLPYGLHWSTNGTSVQGVPPNGFAQSWSQITPGVTQTRCSCPGKFSRHWWAVSLSAMAEALYPGRLVVPNPSLAGAGPMIDKQIRRATN